ncbi:MAG: hypothetical protein ACT4PG_12290 [Panacagrimonas sp.]
MKKVCHPLRALWPALLSCVVLAACGESSPHGSNVPDEIGPSGLARADDLPETGLQGQVPLADQNSGHAALGYRKGVKLVGHNTIMNRGANFSTAWLDDCAYVTTTSPAQISGPASSPYLEPQFNPLNGMAVIDAVDPKNPKLLKILQSPAMLAPHESLQANQARRIIVATRGGTAFDVYEEQDCRNPVLKASINIGVGLTLPPLPGLPGGIGTIGQGLGFGGHALCISFTQAVERGGRQHEQHEQQQTQVLGVRV